MLLHLLAAGDSHFELQICLTAVIVEFSWWRDFKINLRWRKLLLLVPETLATSLQHLPNYLNKKKFHKKYKQIWWFTRLPPIKFHIHSFIFVAIKFTNNFSRFEWGIKINFKLVAIRRKWKWFCEQTNKHKFIQTFNSSWLSFRVTKKWKWKWKFVTRDLDIVLKIMNFPFVVALI